MKFLYAFFGLLMAALFFASPASAVIIYNTGGTPGSMTPGIVLQSNQQLGLKITFSEDFVITDFEGLIANAKGPGNSDQIRVGIRSNVNSKPGDLLYSINDTAPAKNYGSAWTGASSVSWALTAGTYWFTFEVPTDFSGWIQQNTSALTNQYAYTSADFTGWGLTPNLDLAVRIYGTGGGTMDFGPKYPDNVGGVPEPGTWALMILGFGGAGAALRRKRFSLAA